MDALGESPGSEPRTDALPDLSAYRAVRAVLPDVLHQVEHVVGRRFSMDARTARAGFDAACNLFAPPVRSLVATDLGGHTVWFTPSSLRELQLQIAHYRTCKRQRPDTAAGVLLPEFISRKAAPLLAGFKRVLRFRPGTALFHGVNVSGHPAPLPGFPYAADVWYDAPRQGLGAPTDDDPHISALLSPGAAALTGAGVPLISISVSGRALTALADSGASDDFIAVSEVERLGLRPSASARSHVTLADGGKQAILGRVSLRVAVGPLRFTAQPYVLPKLTDVATYILGSSTLAQYGAVLDYEARTLRLRKGTLACKIPFCVCVEPGS